ncbi:MAG: hypothetical protein KZQ88_16345 [Candidatus Thiodiazotropha sp. (ex Dulcina madagascariensis)]|nr:hypothetical protein [Candidatus Thiodiazotropha sp. (ex Dulcina madagascariensis)]MCU7926414.1 hypothetical protein [Candidatus Thiodiazotropha sp. (ex Dulcina madagascariensis)]
MIIVGAGTLLYLAYISVQIIQAPAEVELVKWLISSTEKSGLIVSGVINEKAFEIQFSDAMQYLFLGLVGLTLVSILVSVTNAFISGGIKLVLFTGQSTPCSMEQEQPNQAIQQERNYR